MDLDIEKLPQVCSNISVGCVAHVHPIISLVAPSNPPSQPQPTLPLLYNVPSVVLKSPL